MRTVLEYIFSFIVLLFFQIFILNNISVFGYISPYLYILFILSLPFKIKHTPLIIISFFCGYFVDLLSGGIMGLHTASAVLIGFIRPYVIVGVSSTESDYDTKYSPSLQNMGFKWYLTYSLILVGIHHLVLYYLEYFTFSSFFQTLFRALLNSIFSVFVIVIFQMISFRTKKK